MSDPKIIYYRWAYSPTTGDVTLSHNHEGHPTDLSFHEDMARERSEHDLTFGYAYRMDNGWKITDDEHKPVKDPHVRKSVEDTVLTYEGR